MHKINGKKLLQLNSKQFHYYFGFKQSGSFLTNFIIKLKQRQSQKHRPPKLFIYGFNKEKQFQTQQIIDRPKQIETFNFDPNEQID